MRVLTAAHAVAGATSVMLGLNGAFYRGRILARHPDQDAAVVEVEAPQLELYSEERERQRCRQSDGADDRAIEERCMRRFAFELACQHLIECIEHRGAEQQPVLVPKAGSYQPLQEYIAAQLP